MTYEALVEIGPYNKGDKVPDEKAELWNSMYKVPPCRRLPDAPKVSVPEPVKPVVPVTPVKPVTPQKKPFGRK